jgi:hypothetical protein
MKTVNEQGLKEIRDHLSDLHKQAVFTDAEILQVAAQVEESLNYGNGEAMFVVAAKDSWIGKDEVCHIDDEGYDIEYFDSVDPIDFGASRYKKNHDCQRSGCTVCVAFEH